MMVAASDAGQYRISVAVVLWKSVRRSRLDTMIGAFDTIDRSTCALRVVAATVGLVCEHRRRIRGSLAGLLL